MANEETEIRDLTLGIYDAAIDPGKWPAILGRISRFVGARGILIFNMEGTQADRRLSTAYMSETYDPAATNEYLRLHHRQELADQDRFADRQVMTDRIELVPDHVLMESADEFSRRPNVVWMRQRGVHYRSGALLNKDNVYRDRFSMQFSEAHGPLNGEDIRKTSLLLPHIAKALNVARPTEQLYEKFRSVLGYLDLLKVGVCILRSDGSIVVKNREFQRQIETYPAYRIGATGKLLFANTEMERSIRRLLGGIGNHGAFGARPRKEAVTAILDGDDYRLCVEVSPLNSADDLGKHPISGHILYSLDTGIPTAINAALMARLYDLTGAETEVLSLMAQGLTTPEIAERRSTSATTVKSQTASILSKTMSANRTQLVRLVTNLSANFLSASVSAAAASHQNR
jgi:DNA-binding CsgD family transcriptional regulator